MDDDNVIDEVQTASGLPVPTTDIGKSEIMLYADASFCHEAGVGSWAYTAPALKLEGVASAPGQTVLRFELLAVLHGLEEVLAADKSDLAIRVVSDCQSAVAVLAALREGRPLKRPQRYADRVDLFPRLQGAMNQRMVYATRYTGGSLDHQACHRNANKRLREVLDADPGKRRQIALIRLRCRFDNLVRERGPLLERMAKVDEEITLLQVQITALESAIDLREAARTGADGTQDQKEKL